jgi:hypothetical protein
MNWHLHRTNGGRLGVGRRGAVARRPWDRLGRGGCGRGPIRSAALGTVLEDGSWECVPLWAALPGGAKCEARDSSYQGNRRKWLISRLFWLETAKGGRNVTYSPGRFGPLKAALQNRAARGAKQLNQGQTL